jgi:hypothetical protein
MVPTYEIIENNNIRYEHDGYLSNTGTQIHLCHNFKEKLDKALYDKEKIIYHNHRYLQHGDQDGQCSYHVMHYFVTNFGNTLACDVYVNSHDTFSFSFDLFNDSQFTQRKSRFELAEEQQTKILNIIKKYEDDIFSYKNTQTTVWHNYDTQTDDKGQISARYKQRLLKTLLELTLDIFDYVQRKRISFIY